jgi:fibronectin type 3 domain-containing protein
LQWDAVANTALTGYRVYYGTRSGTYVQQLGSGIPTGNTTTYTFSNLTRGTTYYFVVTSTDSGARESSYSNEVSKLIQ